jgi:hypothetical protein
VNALHPGLSDFEGEMYQVKQSKVQNSDMPKNRGSSPMKSDNLHEDRYNFLIRSNLIVPPATDLIIIRHKKRGYV